MAIKSSSGGYLGIGKQNVFGTSVAPTHWIAWVQSNIKPSQDIDDLLESGYDQFTKAYVKSRFDFGGSFQFYLRPDIAARLACYALGADAVTGASDPYTHTITPYTSVPYLSIERSLDGGLIERVQDCVISEYKISGSQGKPGLITVTILGTKGTIQTASAGSPSSLNMLNMFDATLTVGSTDISAKVEEFEVVYRNKFLTHRGNTIFIQNILKVQSEVEGSIKLLFENDNTYKNVYNAGGTASSEGLGTGSMSVDFVESSSRQFKIEIPSLIYKELPIEPQKAEPDILTQQYVMIGKKDTDALTTITAKNPDATEYDA